MLCASASPSFLPPRPNADAVATAVLNRFDRISANCKPRVGSNGAREWVPLAGIVVEDISHSPPTYLCLSLATGMRCAPTTHLLNSSGSVLHDCHAEILCIRALNRALLLDAISSEPVFLMRSTALGPPWQLKPNLRLHMYASTCPCGDASMEAVMGRQEDATPWSANNPPAAAVNSHPLASPFCSDGQAQNGDALLGRGHFDRLGIVRRKPARPDAPVSNSKSCSDKLALSQCLGLLSGIATLAIQSRDVRLTSLVLPEEELHPVSVDRAFGPVGRMAAMTNWKRGQYMYTPFEVLPTTCQYAFKRPAGISKGSEKAIVMVKDAVDVLVGGVLQGRKRGDVKGASCVSRRRMLELATAVLGSNAAYGLPWDYGSIKEVQALEERREAKHDAIEMAFPGWTRSIEDRKWTL